VVNKKILVTGGTGFVGSYILRYLVKKDYQNLFCLKRSTSKLDLLSPVVDKITFIEGDVLDITSLENAIKQVDIVIHCAAMVSFKSKDKARMMKVNVEGTANIVNISNDNNIEKLIHISSIAAIGRSQSGKMMSEKTDWTDTKNNSDYSISKYLSEMEVWRGFAEGLPVAILNPSLIMGAGFWDIGTGELFKKVYSGLPVYPTGTNGFIDVRDVAQMAILLMEKNIVGERFICSADNIKLKDVFTTMAKILGKKPPRIKMSSTLVSIASFFLNILSFIPGYSSNLTSQSLRNASFDSLYDNSKSVKQLGYTYIPIPRTLEETGKLFLKTFPNKIDYALLGL